MNEFFSNPMVIGGIASIMTVAVTKMFDLWAASRKARDDFRHTDRELLSADEKDFRLTIIKQLQECRDRELVKDKRIKELEMTVLQQERRIIQLELRGEALMKKIDSAAGAAVEAEAAVVQVKEQLDPKTEMPKNDPYHQ